MVFGSPIFLFWFLPVTYIVCRFLPGVRSRNAWLALASLVFYSFGQPVYLPLLLFSVVMNYLFGRLMMSAGRGKRWPAACAVAGNLLLLGTFKYLDFFAGTLNAAFGLSIPLPGLTLPIGISFFTFQGLSYALDVSRDPDSGTRSFGKLVLYISFFPQLIAGPIIKYHDVARQIDSREMTPELTLTGLRRFIAGFAKKLLLANTAGRVADSVFALTAGALDMRLAWLGAVCYTLQIYFDFSGYSDMAIGLGTLFGFQTPENFDYPYISASITEFWRRWHLSLSLWFRDYLYIPLGGNRKGKARKYLNTMITFLVSGLWHGANWSFVVWGGLNGAYQVVGELLRPARERVCRLLHIRRERPFWRLVSTVFTFGLVDFAWLFFRAPSFSAARQMVVHMFTQPHPFVLMGQLFTLALDKLNFLAAVAGIGVLLCADLLQERYGPLRPHITRRALPVRWAVYLMGVLTVLIFGIYGPGYDARAFAYFQF